MRNLLYRPKVPAEARRTLEHYESISAEFGVSFWVEFTEAIEYVRDFPERHHFDSTGRRRSNLKRFPIHFLLRVFPNHIRITAVRHGRQEPNYGTRRQ